jgi:flagellar motor protein MotB
MQKITLSLLFLFISLVLFGQDKNYSTSSRKAIKLYKESYEYLNLRQAGKGINILEKALNIDDQFIQAQLRLADLYNMTGQVERAKTAYKRVVALSPEFQKKPYIELGKYYFVESQYDTAKIYFQRYLAFDKVFGQNKRLANLLLASCDFAKNAMANPVPFNPKNLGPNVNSPFSEYLPTITADGQTLIITRKTEKGEDFFFSKSKGNNEWSMMNPVPGGINTPLNEGAQCISADGQLLFFTGCNRTDGLGRCDIYVSVFDGKQFGDPFNLGFPVNSLAWESQPSFSSDGKTLYFASDRPEGFGKIDIWQTTLTDEGWTPPKNLGPAINTEEDEISPFIHPDNQTLYFASNGRVGIGNRDVYYSRLDTRDSFWTKAVNIGYPINTVNEESSLIVSLDGKTAYFASSGSSGGNNLDLFSFELYPEARPQRVTYVKGTVYDKETADILQAEFELIDIETGQIIMKSKTSKYTGEFLVCLNVGKNYLLNVSKEGYLFYSDNFLLTTNISDKPFLLNIPLQSIKVGESVVLKNIFFDIDSYNLKDESKIELNKLVTFMLQNPKMKIEIAGHTDSDGDDAYNLKLSANRARSVVQYLTQYEIESERLTSKGYGETVPLATNESKEGKAKNRRTEFTILSF